MAKLKPLENHTAVALKKVQANQPVPSYVFLPPAMRKVGVFQGTAPDVKAQLARIENEADPVGLLMAVAMGQPVARFDVNEDGEVVPSYETLPISSRYRLKVIEYLADKVLSWQQTAKQSSGDETWAAAIRVAAEAADE
jgi:hypothetical protein